MGLAIMGIFFCIWIVILCSVLDARMTEIEAALIELAAMIGGDA